MNTEEPKIDCIGGISCSFFGQSDPNKIRVIIFVLHGRMLSREMVFPYCQRLMGINNSIMVVAFDHRNHGSRQVDPILNMDIVKKS
jgi:hypothetical protein